MIPAFAVVWASEGRVLKLSEFRSPDDRCSLSSEHQSRVTAHAPGSAGDDANLPGKPERHVRHQPRRSYLVVTPLPMDPFADIAWAVTQLDPFGFTCDEESYAHSVHQRRLRQVEHESRTVAPELRLELGQVILVDRPTEPEHRGLAVRGAFDFQGHARAGDGKPRAKANCLAMGELVLAILPMPMAIANGQRSRKASLSKMRVIFQS